MFANTPFAGAESVAAARVGSNGVIAGIVLLVLLLVIVISYVVYRILITTLKTSTLVKRPVHARNGSVAVDSEKVPSMDNGLEFALSVWLYVESMEPTEKFKRVLTLGGTDFCSILVVLDKTTNRLYMAFRLSTATDAQKRLTGAENAIMAYREARAQNRKLIETLGEDQSMGYMIVAMEYIPLQRWVNVVAVVNQDIVTLYLDGDIYSVASVDAFVNGTNGGNASAVVAEPDGSMVIGGSLDGFRGFVSKVQMFNYAISVYHARVIYQSGAVSKGILGHIGLNNYRLQWPVVNIADPENTCVPADH